MKLLHTVKFELVALFFFTMFCSQAHAGITQGKVDISTTKSEITIVPQKGFYLNDKAPASVLFDQAQLKGLPKLKTEQKFVFTNSETSSKAQLKFFVCDDAKTVCEQHTTSISLKKSVKTESQSRVETTASVLDTEASKANLLKSDLASDRPSLIMFSAPWCPACIRMKSETLSQSKVKKALKNVNFSILNFDLVENEALGKRFNVKAIPTTILLNKNGEEIFRWLDFQLQDSFVKELNQSLKINSDLTQAKKSAETGDQVAILRLAENSFNQMDWESASKWYGLLNETRTQIISPRQWQHYADISKADDDRQKDEKKTDEYINALEKAATLSSSKIDSLRWWVDFYDVSIEQKKTMDPQRINDTIAKINALVTKPSEFSEDLKKSTLTGLYGFEEMEMLVVLSKAYGLVNDEASQKKIYSDLAKKAFAKKINLNTPGELIHTIYYLTEAKEIKAAEQLIQKLVSKYAKTYVYYNRYASFLQKQKRFEDALVQINLALKFKEGNEPQLNLTKVKILKSLNAKTEALELVDQTLIMIEPHSEKYKRTKTSLVGLKEELLKK